jgi:hypothetical protein
MRMLVSLAAAAAVSAALSIGASPAQAVTTNDYVLVHTGDGPPPPGVNDCAGDLGNPPNCSWDGSPMIVKFDFDDQGNITDTTFGLFASISGLEFTFDFTDGFKWTYDPDDAIDPGVTAFSVKGGNTYNVWEKLGTAFAGIGDFSDNWFPPAGGLSHIVFYDTLNPIPLPAGLLLFLSGLAGIGVLGRYKAKRQDAAIA